MLKVILEILLIISAFILIGSIVYILYTRRINKILKGEKTRIRGKSLEFRLLVVSLTCIITIFVYVFTKHSIEQNKYKNFEIEITTSIMEFDFNDFYEDLLVSSNADDDILIGGEKRIHIKVNQAGYIEQFTLIVLVPRDGELIEYTGSLHGKNIVFKTGPSIVYPSFFHFRLLEHANRLSFLDFQFISNIFDDYEVNQGLWIDINLSFVWEDESVTYSHLVDNYTLDRDNVINPIESITFSPQTFITNIWIGNLYTDEKNQLGAINIKTFYLID